MIEEPALGPGRIAKAPVVGTRRGDRRGDRLGLRLAVEAPRTLLPQPQMAVPPAHLRVDQRRRVGGEAPRHREERSAQVERVGVGGRAGGRRTAQEAGGDPPALRRDGGEIVGHVVLRRARGGSVFGHRR